MEILPPELISRVANFIPGAKSFASFRLTSSALAKATRFNAVERIGIAICPERRERMRPDKFLERIHRGRTVLSKVEFLTVTTCGTSSSHPLDEQLRLIHLPALREIRLSGLKTNDVDCMFALLEHHAATLRSLHILGHSLVVGGPKGRPEYEAFKFEAREAWLPFLIKLKSMRRLASLRLEDLSALFRDGICRDVFVDNVRKDNEKREALGEKFPGSAVWKMLCAGLRLHAMGGQEVVQSAL